MSFKPNIGPTVEPGQMTISQAIQYKGKDWDRLSSTGRNFKRALPMIMLPLFGVFVIEPLIRRFSKYDLFGADGKGGFILRLESKYSNDDIEYTREFMKMRYMQESLLAFDKRPVEIEEYIKKNGEQVKDYETRYDIKKEAPHHKYF